MYYANMRENTSNTPRSLNKDCVGIEGHVSLSTLLNNDIGQVNVAFSRTDSSICDVTFKSVQSLNDEEQVKGEDEDSIAPQDTMSFSWQIARGMVSETLFVLFNCSVRAISCLNCNNAGKFQLITLQDRLSFLTKHSF